MIRQFLCLLSCGIVISACGGFDSGDEISVEIEEDIPIAVTMSEPDMTPEEVAEAFLGAGRDGDEALFSSYMTKKAQQDMVASSGSSIDLSGDTLSDFSVGMSTVTGEQALVPIVLVQSGVEQNGILKMRIDNGPWRIFAMGIKIPGGPEITINFEQFDAMVENFAESVGDTLQEGMETVMMSAFGESEEDIKAHAAKYAALKPVSVEDYESSWMNETDFTGIPSQEVIETLAERLSLSVDVVGLEDVLAEPMNLSLTGISNLEALEKVCRIHNVYPLYPEIQDMIDGLGGAMVDALATGLVNLLDSDDSTISIEGVDGLQEAIDKQLSGAISPAEPDQLLLKAGERPNPIAFAGPYLIEVVEVKENAPLPTGKVRVAARTFGMDAGLLGVQGLLYETMKIDRIVGTKGQSLANTDVDYLSSPEVMGTASYESVGVDLINLLQEVTHIDSIQGGYDVLVPVDVHEVEFTDLKDGAEQSAGELTIKVKSVGDTSQFEISGPEALTDNLKMLYLPLDSDGNPMAVLFDSTQTWSPGLSQSQVSTREVPARIRMKIISGAMIESYPFELKGTPLTRHSEMPEKIEELVFDGYDVPVSIAFKEITDRDPNFTKTLVHILNHSNKDALRISAVFEYLDVSGEELKEFPHSLNGMFTADGQLPIIGRGAETDEETTAFFMPEETRDIRIRVSEVEFPDGTVWKEQP